MSNSCGIFVILVNDVEVPADYSILLKECHIDNPTLAEQYIQDEKSKETAVSNRVN